METVHPITNNEKELRIDVLADNSGSLKIRRPGGSKFKQQKLQTWHPIPNIYNMLPISLVMAAVCLGIGIGLIISYNKTFYLEYDYTNCQDVTTNRRCSENLNSAATPCRCSISIPIDMDLDGSISFFYKLTNFYQNHRLYTVSFDAYQLMGVINSSPNKECEPFSTSNGKTIVPCGSISRSLFNDTFTISLNGQSIALIQNDISFEPDRNIKYSNPLDFNRALTNTVKPDSWLLRINQLRDASGVGFENQHFQNWLRISPFPELHKLYGKIAAPFIKGTYIVDIIYNFPVTSFNGRKYFVITKTSWFGSNNKFLAIVYLIFGCISLLTAIGCFISQKFFI